MYKCISEVRVLRRRHEVTMRTGYSGTSVAQLLYDLKQVPVDATLDEIGEITDETGKVQPVLCFHEEKLVEGCFHEEKLVEG